MSNFKIFETDNFIRKIDKITGKDKAIIINHLTQKVYKQLAEQPYYGNNIKKLRNYTPETWRYRISNYRLFYEINSKEKIVSIISLSTRENAY